MVTSPWAWNEEQLQTIAAFHVVLNAYLRRPPHTPADKILQHFVICFINCSFKVMELTPTRFRGNGLLYANKCSAWTIKPMRVFPTGLSQGWRALAPLDTTSVAKSLHQLIVLIWAPSPSRTPQLHSATVFVQTSFQYAVLQFWLGGLFSEAWLYKSKWT